MKKRMELASLFLAAALLLGQAAAAGGGADDPLVSLEYLQTVFSSKAEKAAQEKLDASGETVYSAAESKWRSAVSAAEAAAGVSSQTPSAAQIASRWSETRLKRGDRLLGVTGTQVLPLAGSVSAQIYSGAVIDVTEGREISGGVLTLRHRYLVAEDASVTFSVSSRTAVLDYCGGYSITPSTTEPDYNAMASALKTLALFKGSDTGFGEGFDLELAPTRIQALIMLIRMLGEEEAALACTAPSPFKDIPATHWGRAYVAYAYEKGYTNGVEDNKFAPDRTASAAMYVEFILRALGYSSTAQTDITTAVDRALEAGVISFGEREALQTNEFLRADVAYLSWYALGAPLPGSLQTLHEKLEATGVFTADDYRRASMMISSYRL
ncbi:MAG: S-layer homology domain-containing protein [Oscillospiraceae bacterium]|nr:S-layer homology domain-containing protein [Oscillospiraceae bacterium]